MLEAAGVPVAPPSVRTVCEVEVAVCTEGERGVGMVVAAVEELDLIAPGSRSVVECSASNCGYGIEPEDMCLAVAGNDFVAKDVGGGSCGPPGGEEKRFGKFGHLRISVCARTKLVS